MRSCSVGSQVKYFSRLRSRGGPRRWCTTPGAFAYLVLAGAAIEATAWAVAGALAALAYRYVKPDVAPLAAAAAFAFCEWLRLRRRDGAPLAQARIHAGGHAAARFCRLRRHLRNHVRRLRVGRVRGRRCPAPALRSFGRDGRRDRAWRGWRGAWWPAPCSRPRRLRLRRSKATSPQSLKWSPAAFKLAVDLLEMTRDASARRPQLIAWPETVITTDSVARSGPLRADLRVGAGTRAAR